MNRKRSISMIIAGLLLAMGSWVTVQSSLLAESQKEKGNRPKAVCRRVQVIHPKSVSDVGMVSFPGRAQASREATLFFRVSGPLVAVNVKPGDAVKKGAVLMRIDPRDYDRRVAGIKARVAATEAQLSKMKNGARREDIKILEQNILVAESAVNLAEKEFHRHHNLLDEHAVSEQLFEKAENTWLTAKARLKSLRQQLQRDKKGARKEDILATKAQLCGLRTELKIAEDQLGDTELKAPFDGMITAQLLENHEMARAGMPVLAIHDISVVEIPVDVPESFVARFLKSPHGNGYQAQFFTLGRKRFSATLHEWNGQADPSTGTYRFVFRVRQPQGAMILPGMTAQLLLKGSNGTCQNGCLLIPVESVINMDGDRGTVWVVDPVQKKAVLKSVRLDEHYTRDGVVVQEGLNPTDLVVAKGAKFVRAGEPLEFQPPAMSDRLISNHDAEQSS